MPRVIAYLPSGVKADETYDHLGDVSRRSSATLFQLVVSHMSAASLDVVTKRDPSDANDAELILSS